MKLTNRLQMVADAVKPCEKFVDIGTDHAYLPTYLVQHQIVQSALACDLRVQPLENAKKTIQQYDVSSKVQLRLSDGLQNIRPQEAQEIAIAGMGGILISSMIETTPWLKDSSKRLLLQPMTHEEDVRESLYKNGFRILEEHTAQEGKHLYLLIVAKYDGKISLPERYVYFSGLLPYGKEETNKLYLEKIENRLRKRAEALENIEPETAKELYKLLEGIAHAGKRTL